MVISGGSPHLTSRFC